MMNVSSELSCKFSNMAFFCACLVVLIHIEIDPQEGSALWWVREMFAHKGITKIAVPFFFLASGFFLLPYVTKRTGGGVFSLVKKRFVTLMIPFLIWNILYFFFMLSLKFLSAKIGFCAHIPFPACETIGDMISIIGLNPIALPGHAHLWFVRCLFVFVVLAPILWKGISCFSSVRSWFGLFLLVGGIVLLVEQFCPMQVSSGLDYNFSITGLFYFCFGLFLRSGKIESSFRWLNSSTIVAFTISFVGLLGFLVVAAATRAGWKNPVFEFWCRWLGIALLMAGVFGLMPKHNVCGHWVGYSFPVYVLHKFVLVLLAGVFGLVGWRDFLTHESVLGYFGRMVLVVATICVLMQVGNRYVPRLLFVLFGGRGSSMGSDPKEKTIENP